jgi:hypothetical protein
MNTWKWSKGEPYYKSARTNKNEKKVVVHDETNLDFDSQQNAIHQSLEQNSFFNQDADMLSITNSMFSRHSNEIGTRREDLDTKIADREMVSQRGVNPFLQTSYVNDIVTRDMFLKPINTTQGRTKNTDQESSTNYAPTVS